MKLVCFFVWVHLSPAGHADTSFVPERYFPNDVGCRWSYAAWSNLDDRCDTIEVSITDTLTFPGIGAVAAIWNNSPWRRVLPPAFFGPSSQWVVKAPALDAAVLSVIVFGAPDDTTPDLRFEIPFEVGRVVKYVDVDGASDSSLEKTTIMEVSDVETPAGKFEEAILITRRWFQPHDHGDVDVPYRTGDVDGKIDYWFKPGIGVVAVEQVFGIRGNPKKFRCWWELVDYKLPDP